MNMYRKTKNSKEKLLVELRFLRSEAKKHKSKETVQLESSSVTPKRTNKLLAAHVKWVHHILHENDPGRI